MDTRVRHIDFSERDDVRESAFQQIWTEELDDVFAGVASYYDTANNVASMGLLEKIREEFLNTIELKPNQTALDVCAGTNAIGMAMIKKQPDLNVSAIDRSVAMQDVGRQYAEQRGYHIDSTIADVHRLPYPDNHFDVVTLQYASRHLRVVDVFAEIQRVLKPGGHFYHCDMLRPGSRFVEVLHYAYLRVSLTVTGWIFKSGKNIFDTRSYFIDALRLFYSVDELTDLLIHLGFKNVTSRTLLGGLVGFHKAAKP